MDNILINNRNFLEGKKVLFWNPEKIKTLVSILNRDRVILVSGMRFAWKTKFIREMIQKTRIGDKAFYFNKELDTLWSIKTSSDIEKLIKLHTEKYQKPQILILQNISKIEWIKEFIGKIYEEKSYKMIIVGNNLKIEGIEEIKIDNTYASRLLGPEETRQADIENILKYGCIEEIFLIKDTYMKGFTLENIKSNIIAKDIIYAYSIKNSFLYHQTLSFLSSIQWFISLREFGRRLEWNDISISLITAIDYINFTLNSKLVKRLYRYDLKLWKEITSKAKYYFADTGIRNTVHGTWLSDDILTENLIYNELEKRWYSIQWWLYGRFEFDFLATPWQGMKDEDLYLHISKESDKNEIQKQARKLWKAKREIKNTPIEIDTDIFNQAPIGHGKEKVLDASRNARKILLVKNLGQVNMRKMNIAWVEVMDLYEFIAKF